MSQNNKWLHWGFVVAWMGLIFSFSAQQGSDSGSLSGSIVSTILSLWHSLVPSLILEQDVLHFIIRKGAHFTVYLVLGLLVVNALSKSGVKSKKRYALALFICFVYAISDEIHQAFVPNRGPSPWDVWLDTSGSAFGLLGYGMATKISKQN